MFEAEARLGGHARTDERDGYHFDRTGHWLHLRDPEVQRMVDELLPDQMATVARKARIFSHGRLTRYPYQANLHGLPPEVVKECLLGVVEAEVASARRSAAVGARAAGSGGAEPDPEREPEPANFEEYCLRHFGAGISRHFMIPYNQRLWGTSPRDITAAWCSRFVPRPNLEQIVAGAVGAGPPELGYNISFRYPRQGGIETFARALQTRMVGGQVHTSCSPDVVDWRHKQIEVGGERVSYDALVSTIPLPELLRRMPELPAEIEEAACRLRCTTLTYLNLATRTTPPADFHWIYVPEPKYPFYRAGVYSNAMASMAPTGGASLYVEMAARGPVSESDLGGALAGLVEAGALRSTSDVVFAEPREIKYAYVIFDHAYYAATHAIFTFLDAHQIFPRGRYGAWTYNAMEDCVLAGREVAATIERRILRPTVVPEAGAEAADAAGPDRPASHPEGHRD